MRNEVKGTKERLNLVPSFTSRDTLLSKCKSGACQRGETTEVGKESRRERQAKRSKMNGQKRLNFAPSFTARGSYSLKHR